MRIFPAFLCFFLFILASGTVSFIYIMWTTYWSRVEAMETKYFAAAGLGPSRPGHRPPNSRHSLARLDKEDVGEAMVRDILTSSRTTPKKSDSISLSNLPLDKLIAHMKVYKEQLYTQLRNTVLVTAKQVQDEDFPNAYNVSYKGNLADNTTQNPSSDQLLCDARNKIKLSTFTKDNEMFRSLKLDRFFPDKPLFENKVYNSCAVVSSGGSLHKSGLGSFIDSHDLVLRFNNAPTDGHEKDVGQKNFN